MAASQVLVARLVAARAKIAKGWCKGSYAVQHVRVQPIGEVYESPRDPCDPTADAWCVLGALHAVGVHSVGAERAVLSRCVGQLFPRFNKTFQALAEFNDHPETRQEHVLQVFDCAIKRAQEEVSA